GTASEGWVPWDVEALNASPRYLRWEAQGGACVTAIVPGLYLLSCGFFTMHPFIAHVYLGDKRILMLCSPPPSPPTPLPPPSGPRVGITPSSY
ncbi:unnamed protein product, partial [Discosporangium mesarthrocarpum]